MFLLEILNQSKMNNLTILDWNPIILSLIGIVTGGAGLKWYSTWARIRKQKRTEALNENLAFRNDLINRISLMSNKIEDMHAKQLELVAQNATLKAQLQIANKELIELRGQIARLRQS